MRITVGQCQVEKITEQTTSFPLRQLFPDHIDEMINYPEDAAVGLSIHSWLVKTPEDIILIDTATGNGRNRGGIPLFDHLNSNYLERLKQTGIAAEQVSLVLMTHIHTDHVGWNTHWNEGEWQPLFPHARYVCSARELAKCQADPGRQELYRDSILPLIKSGQLDAIDIEQSPLFSGVLRYMPTPGHSDDHGSLLLVSDQQHAIFTGDLMHHEVQFEHPHWNSVFCENKPQASLSRRKAIDWALEHQAIWFSSHFAGASFGRVRYDGSQRYQWQTPEEE